MFLAGTAWRQARRERYDLIHSHEEAGILGVWLAKRFGIPHLYDMHSSLPQQLTNFRYARSRWLRRAFEIMEDRTIFGSNLVVTICQDLQDHVTKMGAGDRAVLIENVMGGDVDEPPQLTSDEIRQRWRSRPMRRWFSTPVPSNLSGAASAACRMRKSWPRRIPHARVLVVGGRPEQVEKVEAKTATSA